MYEGSIHQENTYNKNIPLGDIFREKKMILAELWENNVNGRIFANKFISKWGY